MKVLIVEDDIRIAKPLKEDLTHQRLVVSHAMDGEQGWDMHLTEEYDLILLDWMLPKLSGVDLCRKLRESGYAGAILMLTAKGEKQDRIMGLDSGADDYLVKPFDIDELGARVRALLRRGTSASSTWHQGALTVDTRACSVSYAGKPIVLTPTEYRLLMNFLRNPRSTFSKQDLLEKLWTYDDIPSDAVIKMHIKSLRQKFLGAGCKSELVSTVYGFGYKLNVDFK